MSMAASGASEVEASPKPTFAELVAFFWRFGIVSFGGPTAQIAMMHRGIVEERRWLDEKRFLNALSFCFLLPGPEATQMAAYIGWRLHGVAGGLAAGLLFVLPGAALMLLLSMTYAAFGKVPVVEALFLGIKAAVLVIVIEALLRIARRSLHGALAWTIAAASFVAIFFVGLPFPLIIAVAALIGLVRAAWVAQPEAMTQPAPPVNVTFAETLRTVALWLAIWLLPLVAIAVLFGSSHVLAQVALFFSKLAVVTFGGAYAVLAYMAQDVVTHHGWLEAVEMMDGLGLAETTPGPLILVTEFVGYLAAYRHGGGPAVLMGVLGAVIALWATFAPSFLFIFAGAPYIERLIHAPRLKGALAGISAAVVGVILNLAVWFALHVFFAEVRLVETASGWIKLWTPQLATLDWRVVGLAAVSGVLLLWRHWSIAQVLAVAAALALGLRYLGP